MKDLQSQQFSEFNQFTKMGKKQKKDKVDVEMTFIKPDNLLKDSSFMGMPSMESQLNQFASKMLKQKDEEGCGSNELVLPITHKQQD